MSFKRLDPEDISISAESVVAPLWSDGSVELTTFFRSSGQLASNTANFYHEVYQTNPATDTNAQVQFSIAYGHKTGAGSELYRSTVTEKSPSSTIYGQYRNLVFGDEDTDFIFEGQTSNHIYVIALDRARYKEKLFPGTFNLTLTSGSDTLHLTDDSKDTTTLSYVDAGRVFNVVSGSNGSGNLNSAGGSYGKFLPDVGLIILNGTALDSDTDGVNLGSNLTANSATPSSLNRFFNAIDNGNSFELQSEETISSNFIFVRVRNSEFNYSTNPSNITGSGELRHDVMINTPQAYITSVGIYNDNNDLLAVAKLSRPLLKDFTKEALVRIKLDY